MAAKRARPAPRAKVKARSKAKAPAKKKAAARVVRKAPVKGKGKAKAAKAKAPPRRAARARATTPRAKPRKPMSAEAAAVLRAADVQGLISRLPPPVQPMMQRLRAVFLESAPEATELIEQSSPAYFAQGVFARIEPQDRAVLVRFLRGNELPSSAELTEEGTSRTLLVSSVEALRTDVLRKLVREAVMINLDHAPTPA